jgi:hypothetical protein
MNKTEAALAIAEHLQPGDVINTGWKMNWWDIFRPKKWLRDIACWRIQEYQKAYFGDRSVWDSTHTRINLSQPGCDIHSDCIFEVTDPISRFVSLYSIALEDIRILRYTNMKLQGHEIFIMRNAAMKLVGMKYDRGQLLDFLLHQIIGYPKESLRIFDEGTERMVCSTGVAALFNHMRRTIRSDIRMITLPRLFDIVDTEIWKKNGVYNNIDQCLDPNARPGFDRIRTPIERVTPAHFENTEYFQNEFREVARFKNGERYYYWPVDKDFTMTGGH